MQAAHLPTQAATQHVILDAAIDASATNTNGIPLARLFKIPLPVGNTAMNLMAVLANAGFNDGEPASFSCLGMCMHLPADQVMHVLQSIASCAPGSSVVLDYCAPPHLEPSGAEPTPRSHFKPQLLEHMLRHFGFLHVEHTGPARTGSALRTIWATV